MRTTSIVTISLPPKMAAATEKAAKKNQMTRSELIRDALRVYLEELDARHAIQIYKKESSACQLKELRGSLASLIR